MWRNAFKQFFGQSLALSNIIPDQIFFPALLFNANVETSTTHKIYQSFGSDEESEEIDSEEQQQIS